MFRLYSVMAEKHSKPSVSYPNYRIRAGLVLTGLLCLTTIVSEAGSSELVMDGKALVMEKSKGNCLACHAIADGKQPGNVGPPLIAMKARFPDREILRRQIWDATERNPDSRMAPFGRHGILDKQEIDLIVEYLYTL
jgi:sulfur-oxidizing protein SoxX